MNISAAYLATKLKELQDIYEALPGLIKDVLAEGDNRETIPEFNAYFGETFPQVITKLGTANIAVERNLNYMRDVLYYRDIESHYGKGDWREIVERDKHLVLSVKAIHSLRMSHGLGLREAKHVVEAYTAGLFQ